MPFFPLPFLTAFFLIYVLIYLALLYRREWSPLLLVSTGCYALQSILIGVNWGIYALPPMLLPSLALVLPPLTWLTLTHLSRRVEQRVFYATCFFIVMAIVFANLAVKVSFGFLVDVLNIGTYIAFGIKLIWQGRQKNLAYMEDSPLNKIIPAQRAYLNAGIILLFSAGIDIAVAIDIGINGAPRISSGLVGYANFALLLLLLFLFFFQGRSFRTHWEMTPSPPLKSISPSDLHYQEILEKLEREMTDTKLYLKENLSLKRMANKIGVPSRQISEAVNRLRAMNVPQYVNVFRIREACRMLEETDMPVTEIVFAVGFTTKSNFNREFLRVTGRNPSQWRRAVRDNPQGKIAPFQLGK